MRARSGFVVLIVLVVLAVMSAGVIAQFASAGNSEIIGVRSSDDAKARALAESCLTMLQEYVDAELGPPPYPLGKDFDDVLNPDGVAAFGGTENMPTTSSGEPVVTIPKGLTGAAAFLAQHRWRLITRTVGTERGACLVRFDDNADEALPLTQLPPGSVDDPGEGPTAAAEVPWLDRDRAIYLTAIGLFPYLPGTADVDAYARAHARVTLRRLYNAGAAAALGGVAVYASEVMGIKGPVCGGGVTTNTFGGKGAAFRGSGCACGPVTGGTLPPVPPQCTTQCPATPGCGAPSAASAPWNAANLTTAVNAEKPPGGWGAGFDVMANESFGPAPAVGPAVPAPNDLSDIDLSGDRAACKFVYSDTGEVFVWDRLDAAAMPGPVDCTLPYTSDPVEAPCDWTSGSAVCAAGQTPCWKRVHTGGGVFRPNSGAPIPNVAGVKNWGVAAAAIPPANYLCGDATGCVGCDGATNDAGSFAAGPPATWTFTNVDDADLPSPAYIVVATPAGSTTTLTSPGWGQGRPLRATFVANGGVSVSNQATLCGAACDCSSLATPNIATCTPTGVGALASQSCYAIRARGAYQTPGGANDVYIIGDLRAGTVLDDVNPVNSSCYVGDIAAMATSPATYCGSTSKCTSNNVLCWDGKSNVVGNMFADGSAVIRGPQQLFGTLAASQHFCAEPVSGLTVWGNMVAGGRVWFKGSETDPLIVFTGTAASSEIAAIRTMMETAW